MQLVGGVGMPVPQQPLSMSLPEWAMQMGGMVREGMDVGVGMQMQTQMQMQMQMGTGMGMGGDGSVGFPGGVGPTL